MLHFMLDGCELLHIIPLSRRLVSRTSQTVDRDTMRRIFQPLTLIAVSAFFASFSYAQTQLASRIGHTDPSKYKHSRSHESGMRLPLHSGDAYPKTL